MRYWDASALAPLVIAEEDTDRARAWLTEDPEVVTWAWTRVELSSAVERRVRGGRYSREERRTVLARFRVLWEGWDEVADLLVAEHLPPDLTFVCLDDRLGEAAEREGLQVVL